jgi:prephenate dehydrogenase
MLCDVASIKGELTSYYASSGRRFASIHPMFGPTFARMEDCTGENAVIIRESDPEGKAFWIAFFAERGVRVFEYSMAEHDRMMAYSLTLPFVSSLVFSSCVTMSTVPGTTFRKHLEVARGLLGEDEYLLTEILFNPESLAQLEKISSRLNYLWHIVKQRDEEEARKFLGALRKNLIEPPR